MSSIPVFDISNPLGGLLDQAVAMGYVNEKRTTTKGAIASFDDNIEHAVSLDIDIDPTLDGVSEVNVTVAGKNIFNPDKAVADSTGVTKNNGWLEFTTNGDNRIYYKGIKLSQCAFTVICKSDNSNTNRIQLTAIYSDGTNSTIGEVTTTDTNEHTFTGTTTANKTIVELRTGYTNSIKSYIKICMCIGSTPITYEPFIGDTTTLSLGSTVYGGSVSVSEEGGVELTETYNHGTLKSNAPNFTESISTNFTTYYTKISTIFTDIKTTDYAKGLCDQFTFTDSPIATDVNVAYVQSGYLNIRVETGTYADAAEFKNWVIANGIELTYEKEEPASTDLDPIDPIKTIVGENNIWADTGDIEVGYYYQLYQPI